MDSPQYVSGVNWNWPASVKVHVSANIVGHEIEVGENTRIDGFVTITGRVKIGRNCHIAIGACLFGAAGIMIGDHCGISAGVKVFTGTDDPDIGLLALHAENLLERAAKTGAVTIEDYVTVGANSVLYPGVRIGTATMVGALSYVNHDLEPGWIYAGSPARGIRPRPPLKYPVCEHVYPANFITCARCGAPKPSPAAGNVMLASGASMPRQSAHNYRDAASGALIIGSEHAKRLAGFLFPNDGDVRVITPTLAPEQQDRTCAFCDEQIPLGPGVKTVSVLGPYPLAHFECAEKFATCEHEFLADHRGGPARCRKCNCPMP